MKLIYKKNKTFANADRHSYQRVETINEVLDEKVNNPDRWKRRQDEFNRDLANEIKNLEESIERTNKHKQEITNLDEWWTKEEDENLKWFKEKHPDWDFDQIHELTKNDILRRYSRIQEEIKALPKKKALLAKLKANKINLGDEIAGTGIAGDRNNLRTEGIVIGYEKNRGYIIDPYKGYFSWTVFIKPIGAVKLNSLSDLEKEWNDINNSLITYYVVSSKKGEYFLTELQARNSYDVKEQWKKKSNELGYIIADSKDSHDKGLYGITPFKEVAEKTLENYKSSK